MEAKHNGITWEDGSTITWEEAAAAIEVEGRLIVGELDSLGGRCVIGVIGDFEGPRYTDNIKTLEMVCYDKEDKLWGVIQPLVQANNAFVGTPEERAVYMAEFCRQQASS